jgi:hypothetical protein
VDPHIFAAHPGPGIPLRNLGGPHSPGSSTRDRRYAALRRPCELRHRATRLCRSLAPGSVREHGKHGRVETYAIESRKEAVQAGQEGVAGRWESTYKFGMLEHVGAERSVATLPRQRQHSSCQSGVLARLRRRARNCETTKEHLIEEIKRYP